MKGRSCDTQGIAHSRFSAAIALANGLPWVLIAGLACSSKQNGEQDDSRASADASPDATDTSMNGASKPAQTPGEPSPGTPSTTATAGTGNAPASGSPTHASTSTSSSGGTNGGSAADPVPANPAPGSPKPGPGAVPMGSGGAGSSSVDAGGSSAAEGEAGGADNSNPDPTDNPGPSPEGASVCDTADEDQAVTLACPDGQIIETVDFASYGTPTGDCGSFALGDCDAATSVDTVEMRCVGRATCSVTAANG
ncbi:MAG TPA: hypothetical protein VHM70_29835, partial [Polyangiaceae bacterium]|nr:hypothetical protein [Polyangiaceae bacterium]